MSAKKNLKVTRSTYAALRRGQVERIKQEIVASIERMQYADVDFITNMPLTEGTLLPSELQRCIEAKKIGNDFSGYSVGSPEQELAVIDELVSALRTVLTHEDHKIVPHNPKS